MLPWKLQVEIVSVAVAETGSAGDIQDAATVIALRILETAGAVDTVIVGAPTDVAIAEFGAAQDTVDVQVIPAPRDIPLVSEEWWASLHTPPVDVVNPATQPGPPLVVIDPPSRAWWPGIHEPPNQVVNPADMPDPGPPTTVDPPDASWWRDIHTPPGNRE